MMMKKKNQTYTMTKSAFFRERERERNKTKKRERWKIEKLFYYGIFFHPKHILTKKSHFLYIYISSLHHEIKERNREI